MKFMEITSSTLYTTVSYYNSTEFWLKVEAFSWLCPHNFLRFIAKRCTLKHACRVAT